MIKYIIPFVGLFLMKSAFSQDTINKRVIPSFMINKDSNLPLKSDAEIKEGSIVIQKDRDIDKLVELHKAESDTMVLQGYRLQVFASSGVGSRSEALSAKAEFIRRYPDIPSYIISEMPWFKIRVGDFRDKMQAMYWKDQFKSTYPNAYIVRDQISHPYKK